MKHRRSGTGVLRVVQLLVLALAALLYCARSPVAAVEPRAARVADYRIDARLDPDARSITGHQVLRWRNETTAAAAELYFNLHLNAFAGNGTALMAAHQAQAAFWSKRYPGEWGGITVSAVRIGGTDVTARLEYVQPDGGNPADRAVARLLLDRPVRPGEETEVEMDFVARLPRVFLGTGHAAPFFMAAHWYPKIGVFANGKWNCHPLAGLRDPPADFGEYDVRLTLPDAFVVGHTGALVEERKNGDGTRTVGIRAEDVPDFVWVADPRFRVVERRMGETMVRFLLQPNHMRQAGRYVDALQATMNHYRKWFGPCPYPVLTVVDPGPGARDADAMQYPMLFTAGTTWWMPAWLRVPESLIARGFGHQYWSAMVANDAPDAFWLSEGINAYLEGRLMEEIHGTGKGYLNWLGLRIDATAKHRFVYLAGRTRGPITGLTETRLYPIRCRVADHAKAALVLETLARQFGHERIIAALGDYLHQWRFRQPGKADLRASLRGVLGKEIDSLLDGTMDGTGVLDYAVTRVEASAVPSPAGQGASSRPESGVPSVEKRYRSEVVVERRGEIKVPVEILVVFEDRTQTRELWDGRDRWRRLEIVSKHRAEYAEVDPDRRVPLDVNLIDNSRMRSAGTRGVIRLAGRAGLWVQHWLHLVTAF